MKGKNMAGLYRMLLLSGFFLLMSILGRADAEPQSAGDPLSKKPSYVKAKLIADISAIHAGRPFHLGVELSPEPGWHTYYKEPGDAGMPTKIQWDLPKGFVITKPLMWERPKKFNEGSIITFGYDGKSLLSAEVEPPSDLKAGQSVNFSAKVKWLSCHELCVPGGADVALTLPTTSEAVPGAANKEEFAKANFDGPISEIGTDKTESAKPTFHFGESKADAVEGAHEDKGLLFYLAFAFIGGIILNFMPCVLPVVAIKVVSLLECNKGDGGANMRKQVFAFISGIMSSFLSLAALVLALQAAGHTVGWGFQFQYPPFVIAMCTIVLLFALSLFGLFDIYVGVGQAEVEELANKEGLSGSFFKGVLATILSTPCTAPFLGTALGFAFIQPWWVVVGIFAAVGLGMSSPYVLMMLNPACMKYLPKPGMWMVKLKEGMGFVLLATVVWLLSILAHQVGIDAIIDITYFLVTVTFAVWILSRFVDLTSSTKRAVIIRTLAGAITLLAAYVFILSKPALLASGSNNATAETMSTKGLLDWQPFSVDKLDSSVNAGKTVLVDCTATWCLTCQVNEKAVLNNQAVVEKLKNMNAVLLKADWTNQDLAISQFLRKFGRSGVPMYVIFPAKSPDKPILLPEIITVPLMLDKLQEAS
jgi:thiol:disulfide interchange protein